MIFYRMTIHILYFSCKYVQQGFMEKGWFNSMLSKKKELEYGYGLSKSMGSLGSIVAAVAYCPHCMAAGLGAYKGRHRCGQGKETVRAQRAPREPT